MPRPILISFYGHKGGVGKTTTVHEFACILAKELGYRVLIVDADSQCDLTRSLMRQTLIDLARKSKAEFRSDDDAVEIGLDLYRQKKDYAAQCKSFGESLLPLLRLRKGVEVEDQVRNTALYHAKEFGELYLLPGVDVDMHNDVSDLINQAILSTEQFLAPYLNIPAIPQAFIRKLARANNIDLVLIDLNPASDRFNQVLLEGSNYYIMPVLPEYRSRRAVLTFSKILQGWNESIAKFRTEELQMPAEPFFLGYLYQRVKITNYEKGTLPKAYKGEIEATRDAFRDVFMKRARTREDFVLPPAPFIPEANSFGIATVGAGLPFSYSSAAEFNYAELRGVAEKAFSYRDRYFYYIEGIFRNMTDEDLQSIQYNVKFARVRPVGTPPQESVVPETRTKKRKRSESVSPLLTATDSQTQAQLMFQAEPNRGAGDCGFLSFGITRRDLVNSLLAQSENQEMRRILREEIGDAIGDDIENASFLSAELKAAYKKIDDTRTTAEANLTQSRSAIRDRYQAAPPEEGDSRRLIDWLHQNRHHDEAQVLMQREEVAIAENNNLLRFLERLDVYKSYANGMLREGTWMGVQSAIVYSTTNNIPLRIWRRVGDTSNLEAFYRNHVQSEHPVVDLLYISWMHFERLRVQPAPAQAPAVIAGEAEEVMPPRPQKRQRAASAPSASSFFQGESQEPQGSSSYQRSLAPQPSQESQSERRHDSSSKKR